MNNLPDISARELELAATLRDNFAVYAASALKIRSKSGDIVPFNLNAAQAHIHRIVEKQRAETGRIRAILVKGRQEGCCVSPNTKILTAQLDWIAIKQLKIGDELVSVDENVPKKGKGFARKMRTAVVEKIWKSFREAYEIETDDGRKIICSGEHRWLTIKSQSTPKWRSLRGETRDRRGGIAVGDLLRTVVRPWGKRDYDDAWFGGMIDGEGSLDYKNRTGTDLSISQVAGPVLDRLKKHCVDRSYNHCVIGDKAERPSKFGKRVVYAISISHMFSVFKLMGLSRPTRFIDKRWWEGKCLPKDGWNKITAIRSLGEMELIDIQTSTQTYVAEGFVSHNSTYIQGRFYWRTTHRRGVRAFILTHDSEATNNLFDITQRYHDNCPELLKPHTGASSAHELIFDRLDSGYKVGTAGNKAVGRSSTIQFFHGSEVAYWPNSEEHSAGVMQAVPDANDTELWLESTSNGPGDYFHNQWQLAVRGESGFVPIFIPWFWQSEYTSNDPDFLIASDEKELAHDFNLTNGQLAWRRTKIRELGGGDMGLHRFMREYPFTSQDAFSESGEDKLISSSIIRAALEREVKPILQWKPVWGLDIGGETQTGDRTALSKRQANVLLEPPKWWRGKDPMQIAGLIKAEYDDTETHLKPSFICVDVIFQGAGVVARLRELGLQVIGVNVAESSSVSEKCNRLRDELWWKARQWFEGRDVRLPKGENTDILMTELAAPRYSHTSAGKLVVESKDDMKERGVHSPDLADSFCLSLSGPNIEADKHDNDRYRGKNTGGSNSWMVA